MSSEVAPLFAKTLKVRFTQPSDLNDPFEFRPLIDFTATADEFRGEIDAQLTEMFCTPDAALAMMEKQQASDPNFPKMAVPIHVFRGMIAADPALRQKFMKEMRRHQDEFLENATQALVWENLWEKLQQTFGQSVGIFSLSEDSAHILMWSHYASQHSGVVVEFDENNPWFHQKLSAVDDLRHLVKVAYVENPHPRSWRQVGGADVLYTKNAEWAYEREWRIIRVLADGTEISPGKFCFDVPPKAVRSIVFGCRTTSAFEQDIRAHIAMNPALSHVSFKRAKLMSGKIGIIDAIP
jgi:hypothetical protein